ncbi:hypothetical protein [Streptomyces sp. NEAU-L66]|uniref:hypothetical protein n=1 Tax=Streptomyces sp. NEAU-L66 TaxID=3390812 RepID=UPI0039C68847
MPSEEPPEDAARRPPLETDEWYAARNATTALRDVLTAAGMARNFPYLRACLNTFGHGFIELGRHRARRRPGEVGRGSAALCRALEVRGHPRCARPAPSRI